MRKLLLLAVIGLALGVVAASRVTTIVRPDHALYDCLNSRWREQPCRKSFDVRLLLGLRVSDAERLAKLNGYRTEERSRDGHEYIHIMDLETNRIDVDTEHGVVTRIHEFG